MTCQRTSFSPVCFFFLPVLFNLVSSQFDCQLSTPNAGMYNRAQRPCEQMGCTKLSCDPPKNTVASGSYCSGSEFLCCSCYAECGTPGIQDCCFGSSSLSLSLSRTPSTKKTHKTKTDAMTQCTSYNLVTDDPNLVCNGETEKVITNSSVGSGIFCWCHSGECFVCPSTIRQNTNQKKSHNLLACPFHKILFSALPHTHHKQIL